MFRNKKTSIKFFSLALVLLMMASIFAGCNNKALQEAIDAAKAQADAANQVAANAQAAADAASKLAEQLQKQLEEANAQIDEQKKANEQLQNELEDAKSKLDSIENEPDPEPVDPGDWWDEVKGVVTEEVLAELSQLKVKYLTLRQLWYTEDNYYKLAKVFDNAYTDLYKATTAEGVNEVMTNLAAEIAKIPNIMSDGEAIQAIIRSFGDVDTDLFLTHEEIVKKAREDYIAWLTTYSQYFTSVGFDVNLYVSDTATPAYKSALDGYVMNTFNIATSTLRYAETKIEVLRDYADKVAEAAYDAVNTILNNPTFANVKTKSSAIEAAYALYKIFMVANGGDDSPIQKLDPNDDKKVLLTGEEFVKNYVLVLYDNWFHQYQSQAKALLDSLPKFFMNNATATDELASLDTAYLGAYLNAAILDDYTVGYGNLTPCKSSDQLILNEFERIATLNAADFLKLTYSSSFKGTLSIEEAYDVVDAAVAKAVAEMAQVYYNKIVVPNLENTVAGFKDKTDKYVTNPETDTVYKDFDEKFIKAIAAKVDTYVDGLKQFKVPTYAELDNRATASNGLTNISNLKVFNRTVDANGDVSLTLLNKDTDASAFIAVLQALNDTVKAAAKYYATGEVELNDNIKFYDFKKTLSKEIEKFASNVIGKTDGTLVTKANDTRVAQGGDSAKLSNDDKSNYNKAIVALASSARDAIMALDYDTYTATTYQALNSSSKALYYKDDGTLSTDSKDKQLTIVVDKLVVAKDAAVDIAKQYADQMFNKLLDLCRSQVTAHINAAKSAYAVYLSDDDSLNLAKDIGDYVDKLTSYTTISAVADFKSENFSNKNNKINTSKYSTLKALTAAGTGYYLETVGTNEYLVHIRDHSVAADTIINGSTASKSYEKLATDKFNEVCNIVLYDKDANPDTDGAYQCLEKVRLLAYSKDDAIVKLNKIRETFKGVWDSSKGEWKTITAVVWMDTADYVTNPNAEPNYQWVTGPLTGAYLTYERTSSRAARYLQELDAVYERVVLKIKAVTILNSDNDFDKATGKVDVILQKLFSGQDNKKASESDDDYSFKVAYDRYYALNPDGSSAYDWSKYNA